MAGLVPAIHVFEWFWTQDVDARDTSAFTPVFDGLCAGMTWRECRLRLKRELLEEIT